MQITTLTVAVLAAASGAQAGCFSHGVLGRLGVGLYGSSAIENVCTYLAGGLAPYSFRSTCIMDKFGIKWDWRVSNDGDKYKKIEVSQCTADMEPVASGCPKGGDKDADGVNYKGDPNASTCISR
ncbi:hypothetical protein F5B20DRAFT_592352 [Whalleya microplaca]|nr:hypothetical protein F5B20DRAFT_592352 [Whalleya microplaca]